MNKASTMTPVERVFPHSNYSGDQEFQTAKKKYEHCPRKLIADFSQPEDPDSGSLAGFS
jgi:hypothetical protein